MPFGSLNPSIQEQERPELHLCCPLEKQERPQLLQCFPQDPQQKLRYRESALLRHQQRNEPPQEPGHPLLELMLPHYHLWNLVVVLVVAAPPLLRAWNHCQPQHDWNC
jgi:hypothetical protein